jgi:hypothetical protein
MGKYNLNAFTNIMFAIIFYTVLILFVFPNLLNLGGLGLGYSLLILELVKLLTWYYLSNKVLHFKSDRGFWKFLLFIFIAYIFYSSINSYFISSSNSFIKILYIIVNFVSIYLLMYFFKLLKKDDFKFIAEIFNLKLMKNYVKTELKK